MDTIVTISTVFALLVGFPATLAALINAAKSFGWLQNGGANIVSFWGNLLALASGVSFAALAVLLRKQKDARAADSVWLGNVLTALVFLPFCFGSGPNRSGWIGVLLLGVFQLGLSYVLFTRGIRHVRALEASLISTIEPVLNPIWVLLWVGERPHLWALVGGSIVLACATVRGVLTARANAPIKGTSQD